MDSGNESDAPEELTAGEGIKQHDEIRKVQMENVIRVAKEGKERRRQWSQRRTPAKSDDNKNNNNNNIDNNIINNSQESADKMEGNNNEEGEKEYVVPGMLPRDIIDLLAARERQTFSSDSEEEIINQRVKSKKNKKSKKRPEASGPETVLLNEITESHCLKNSMEFLKRRKMQVARSNSVLTNANQALCLISSKGSLLSKS